MDLWKKGKENETSSNQEVQVGPISIWSPHFILKVCPGGVSLVLRWEKQALEKLTAQDQ